MLNFNEYLTALNESRIKTQGVKQTKEHLSGWLYFYGIKNNIEISVIKNTFYLDIFYNDKFKNIKLYEIINMCENLGFFPSLMTIDNTIDVFDEFKNSKETDFIEFLKKYNLGNFKKLEFKFESWQDKDIEQQDIPDMIYHVCREVNYKKIKEYGLVPKAKSKRSYHPDRIYLFLSMDDSVDMVNIFKAETNEEYVIVKIAVDDDLRNMLYLKQDPNHTKGFYTTSNIHPNYIKNI